jgi:hypothetical protein
MAQIEWRESNATAKLSKFLFSVMGSRREKKAMPLNRAYSSPINLKHSDVNCYNPAVMPKRRPVSYLRLGIQSSNMLLALTMSGIMQARHGV